MNRVKRTTGNTGRWAAFVLLFVLAAVSLGFPRVTALADGGTAEMTAERTEAKQGEILAVTVTLHSGSADVELGSETGFKLHYDSNILSFTDSGGYTHPNPITWKTGYVDGPGFKEVFRFNVIGQGDVDLVLSDVELYNADGAPIPVTVSPESIHIHVEGMAEPTQATEPQPETPPTEPVPTFNPADLASADLKSLEVTPVGVVFEPNVTNYTLTVPNDVTRIGVNATTANAEATYVVEGYDQLEVGENTVTIRVTAPDGTAKEYVLIVTRAALETQAPTQPATQSEGDTVSGFPFAVDGSEWYVTTIPKGTDIPIGFKSTNIDIGGYKVPGYRSTSHPDLYLIYAGQNNQSPALAFYRQSDGYIFPYVDDGSVKNNEIAIPKWVVYAAGAVILALIAGLVLALIRGSNRPAAPSRGTQPPARGQSARPAQRPQQERPARREAPARAPRPEQPAAPAGTEDSLYVDTPEQPAPEQKPAGVRPTARREFDVFKPLYTPPVTDLDEDDEEDEFDDEEDDELFGYREEDPKTDQGRQGGDARGKESPFVAPSAAGVSSGAAGSIPDVDLTAIQQGLEREVSRMGAADQQTSSRPSRPAKPAVMTHRINEATVRIDSDTVKGNRG